MTAAVTLQSSSARDKSTERSGSLELRREDRQAAPNKRGCDVLRHHLPCGKELAGSSNVSVPCCNLPLCSHP